MGLVIVLWNLGRLLGTGTVLGERRWRHYFHLEAERTGQIPCA